MRASSIARARGRPRGRWLLAGTAAAAMALSMVALPRPAGAATVTFDRISGANRYDTAAKVATAAFPTGVPTVVLASGADFPDALAGNYLAGVLHGAILLTSPTALSPETSAALSTLHPATVDVLGGTAAVSDGVVSQVRSLGYTVNRIFGADRYETAAKVAASQGTAVIGTSGGGEHTALLASGSDYPDAIAAGPLSYDANFPLLLTNGASLSPDASGALKTLGIDHVIILGGTAVVSPAVESAVQVMDITTERLAGADRVETAARIANYELNHLSFATDKVVIARADNFPDALAAGPFAGIRRQPLLLAASPDLVGGALEAWLTLHAPGIVGGTIIGGTEAISSSLATQLESLASSTVVPPSGGGGTTPPPPPPPPPAGTATHVVLSPVTTTAYKGSAVTLTATAEDANNVPVPNAKVDFSVVDVSTEGGGSSGHGGGSGGSSGGICTLSSAAQPNSTGTTACTIDASDPATGSNGQATFTYTWVSPAGQRGIEASWPQQVFAFTGPIGTQISQATASKSDVTWVNAVTGLTVVPTAQAFPYGATATNTATLINVGEEGTTPVPVANQTVNFGVYPLASGTTFDPTTWTPPTGSTPVATGTATTGSDGTAALSYKDPTVEPADNSSTSYVVYAYWDQNANGALDSGEMTAAAQNVFTNQAAAPATLTVTPTSLTKLVETGATATVTALLEDQYGNPVPGTAVVFTITGGTATLAETAWTTGPDGTAVATVNAPSSMEKDTVTATVGTLKATMTLNWVQPAIDGTYNGTVIGYNLTGTDTTMYIDLATSDKQYLRFDVDLATDTLLVNNSSSGATDKFVESVKDGAKMTITYSTTGTSAFNVAMGGSSNQGGSGGGGQGGNGS